MGCGGEYNPIPWQVQRKHICLLLSVGQEEVNDLLCQNWANGSVKHQEMTVLNI